MTVTQGHEPPVRNGSRLSVGLAMVGVLLLIVNGAWLSDDAYMTLRVVDNLWSGYGLRWNAIERVQVYTHPLWAYTGRPVAAAHARGVESSGSCRVRSLPASTCIPSRVSTPSRSSR